MGVAYGKLWLRLEQLHRDDPFRVLLVGLEGAGKSTMLHSFKLGRVETAVPTMGLQLEKIEHHNTSVVSWDLVPLDRVRQMEEHFYANTVMVVFVVDSADKEAIPNARKEVHRLLEQDPLINASLLVLANKQDVPGAVAASDLAIMLGLPTLVGRQWHVQGTCALEGPSEYGLYEAVDWMTATMARSSQRHPFGEESAGKRKSGAAAGGLMGMAAAGGKA